MRFINVAFLFQKKIKKDDMKLVLYSSGKKIEVIGEATLKIKQYLSCEGGGWRRVKDHNFYYYYFSIQKASEVQRVRFFWGL